MNRLAIDTSTQTMGVALMKENNIAAELTSESHNDHSSRLMPAVQEMMQQTKMSPDKLDSIIVSNGPGSYTGTRIGITTAKTMAWALDIPITTVSSLKLIAYNGAYFSGYICPFIDARRGRVYTALYYYNNGELVTVKEETNILFVDWLKALNDYGESILFLSSDRSDFQELIEKTCPTAILPAASIQQMRPSHLFTLASETLVSVVHEVVPNYLRLTEAETKWLENQRKSGKKGDQADG